MLSARIADRMGFHALYMTGYGISASYLGLPDAGIATYSDMVSRARTIAEGIVTPLVATWEDRVSAALAAKFGEREGRRLFQRYVTHETRSGLYREVTTPEIVPDDLKHLENLEERIEVRAVPRSACAAFPSTRNSPVKWASPPITAC